MAKTLIEMLSKVDVASDEGEMYELGEISTDDDLEDLAEQILDRLAELKKDIPDVLKFGDDTPIKNRIWNNIIEELDWSLRYGPDEPVDK